MSRISGNSEIRSHERNGRSGENTSICPVMPTAHETMVIMMKKITGILSVFLVALLLFSACGKENEKKVVLGYDNTAEEAIIANMLIDLIEQDTDIKVEVVGDLAGGETVLHPAITSGEIDIYPEYTGTAWLTTLKHTDIPERDTLNKQLFSEYNEKFDISWIGLYGFNNSYGIAVSNTVAEKYNLKTYSDLAKVSGQLTFGAEPGFFEREDGYNGLCEAYGFAFKASADLVFSVKYDAVAEGKVDVINIFTTDGRLAVSDVTVLEDDLHYFPEYLCGTIIRNKTLEKYPELRETLVKMDGLLTDADMSALNNSVEVDGEEPETVAENFLKEKGLLG